MKGHGSTLVTLLTTLAVVTMMSRAGAARSGVGARRGSESDVSEVRGWADGIGVVVPVQPALMNGTGRVPIC